jgi:hypothetical protein
MLEVWSPSWQSWRISPVHLGKRQTTNGISTSINISTLNFNTFQCLCGSVLCVKFIGSTLASETCFQSNLHCTELKLRQHAKKHVSKIGTCLPSSKSEQEIIFMDLDLVRRWHGFAHVLVFANLHTIPTSM